MSVVAVDPWAQLEDWMQGNLSDLPPERDLFRGPCLGSDAPASRCTRVAWA